MNPTILTRDKLLIRTKDLALKINDIILYKDYNKKLISHRIIDFIYCGGIKLIIAKGDNCEFEDQPIELINVVGVVEEIFRK